MNISVISAVQSIYGGGRRLGAHEAENVSEKYYPARSFTLSNELLWITFLQTKRSRAKTFSARCWGNGEPVRGGM